jgi:spermidine synthase
LHCADANDFIAQSKTAFDVIFTDLYEANGAHELQTQQAFMASCAEKLSDHGVLVANQWASEFRDSQKVHAALNAVFGDQVIYLQVAGGNTIAFAYKDTLPDLKRDTFYEHAQKSGLKIHCDLQRQARAFWRQNAEALQTGRYRKRA